MRAIRVEALGGPEVLQLTDIPAVKAPGPGQAVVRIVMAGVNFLDVGQRRGTYPCPVPFTLGVEGAGVVEAVGEGVRNVKPSDRVAFTGIQGAYAEAILAQADRLTPLPDEFSFEQGAGFPLQCMTAHYLIHEFRRPGPGCFVLVHAAAGGVGGLLVQWAKHLGATVIGTVSNEAKARSARASGADHVIVYTARDFVSATKSITGGRGADLIFDGVGRTTFSGDLEAAAERGHIVVFGAASGPADPISPNAFIAKALTVSGGAIQDFVKTPEALQRRALDVIEGVRAGWLRLNIHRVLPLTRAREAHELLEGRSSEGKLLLSPG